MPVVTKEEIVRRLSERMGDDTSDEALALIEDVTDTYTDLEARVGDDWKTKYEDNDKMWREKYKSRFFAGEDKPNSDLGGNAGDEDDDEETPPQPKTYDELFKEGDK
jgi:hypothetical protein